MGLSLVTVVIPAFNAEATLPETLASVQSQTYADLEILVVDDGSTDRTPEIVAEAAARDPRLRLLRQANAGVASARNIGTAVARGDYVGFVDADDIWHPRKIELQMAVVAGSPVRPILVYAWSRRIDAKGCVLADLGRPAHSGKVEAQLAVSNFLRNASVALLRRDALLAVGGFDPGLQAAGAQGAEDLKLYLALAERGEVGLAPYFLVGYRFLPQSMSRSVERMHCSIDLVLADLEIRRPKLPSRLFALARANYDLYAANLALSNGQVKLLGRYVGRALRRSPFHAAALLGLAALARTQEILLRRRGAPAFDAVAPDEDAFRLLFPNGIERYLGAAVRRIMGTAPTSRSVEVRGT